MFSQAYSLDLHLFRLINNQWTSPSLDRFMPFISDFGFWWMPFLSAVILISIFGKFRARLLILLLGISILIGDAGLTQGIRAIVNRPRPWQTLENVRFVDLHGVEIRRPSPWEKGRSLPSGHVCNNTAFAILVAFLYGSWGILAWIWALLIAYSRIYTGAHYPSDVLISILLSITYTPLIFHTARFLWKKYAPKYFPKLYKNHPTL